LRMSTGSIELGRRRVSRLSSDLLLLLEAVTFFFAVANWLGWELA
jgi:hypothetical protein